MKLLSISVKRKYICRKNFKKAAGMFPWEQLYRVFPGGKPQSVQKAPKPLFGLSV